MKSEYVLENEAKITDELRKAILEHAEKECYGYVITNVDILRHQTRDDLMNVHCSVRKPRGRKIDLVMFKANYQGVMYNGSFLRMP